MIFIWSSEEEEEDGDEAGEEFLWSYGTKPKER